MRIVTCESSDHLRRRAQAAVPTLWCLKLPRQKVVAPVCLAGQETVSAKVK